LSLRFLRPGLQTSIQDGGRPGMMRWGLCRGGAADTLAMAMANRLLGNPSDHPCIEVTLTGPAIEFTATLSIAVCGAYFDLRLNDKPVANNTVIQVRSGDVLEFGALKSGARGYLALAAEIDLPRSQGSLATHLLAGFGGLEGRALRAGDTLPLRACRRVQVRALPQRYCLDYRARPLIRVVSGADAELFPAEVLNAFYRGEFSVSSQSNRMGIRLSGALLATEGLPQVVSSALCPGTIQVPPGGQPIVSFIEGQTIGGYPRIAHVISADQHRLGQLQANDRLNFERIDTATAHRILQHKLRLLAELEDALQHPHPSPGDTN